MVRRVKSAKMARKPRYFNALRGYWLAPCGQSLSHRTGYWSRPERDGKRRFVEGSASVRMRSLV